METIYLQNPLSGERIAFLSTAAQTGGELYRMDYFLAPEGIKNNAFNLFLLFYYQQIVGLDPGLCGLALFLALLIDAVTDPAVGV